MYGCEGAVVVGLAAATFGLVSGGLIGGPVGNFLVRKHNLAEVAASRRTGSGQDGDDAGAEVALPNGVSNMQAFTKKWGPSPTAFLVVPGVGSVIIDVINALILTALMNFLG